MELSIYERTTSELISEIGHGRIDAAILATSLREASLEERVLFYDPFYLYAHAAEKLLRKPEVRVKALDPAKMWLLEDGHCVRTQVIRFCEVQERTHLGSVRFAAGSFETIKHLIDASEGYTIIPESYARTLSKTARQRSVRPFAGSTPIREISLVHHRRCWKREVIDALYSSILQSVPRSLRQVAADGNILPVRGD